MSRRGGARGSESRRDQPSPAASRGGGAGRGTGRGRGGPVPSPSPAPRTGPPPSQVISPPQPPRTAQAPPPSAPASHASASSSAPPKAETLAGEMANLSVQDAPPAAPPSSSKQVKLPRRPGYGRAGTKCMVRANHFLVQIADTDLCQYNVTITPEVISKKVNRDIISHLVKLFSASHLGGKKAAYDGMKTLYTAGQLPFESKLFDVKLPENDDQPQRGSSSSQSKSKKRDRDFRVDISFTAKVDIAHLKEFIRGRNDDDDHQSTIQALDVVMRHKPAEKYTVVGRSLFHHSLGDHGELGNGIEYWKGFFQSLRPTQMGLSLNIDVSARGFYEPIPVVKFIEKYLNLRGPARRWTDQERLKVRKVLKGIKVESHHLAHKKSYKVTDISKEPLDKIMFSLDDSGRKISVEQYFVEKYKIPIKYGCWPAIQAGSSTKPVSIPLEICSIVKGQRYTKKLNENQVRNLLRATCKRPPEREKSIKLMVDTNEYNKGEVVNQFGMNVKAEMTMVEARVLPPPMILYHGTGRSATESPRNGAWNMINKRMINPGRIDFWSCVNFSSSWGPDSPYMFCEDFIKMCISRGMVFEREPIVPIYSDQPMRIPDVLKRVHKESLIKIAQKTGIKDRPIPLQLLIVILPEASGAFYGKIKRICETELGIITQCCHPKKAEKGGQQYLENLSLKVNVKVGGRNSVLNEAVNRTLPVIGERPTIIFGADVTHPSPGEVSSPSIAAVVASMDWPEVTKYRGLVSAQGSRDEMILDLYKTTNVNGVDMPGGMIRDHLLAFYQKTRQKPDRILFYRDGVSEGQFSKVLLDEVLAIRKGCASLQKDYAPRVTFVVVQKRHHTRLFPVDNKFSDRSGNVLPGTVVDTTICHPSQFDFYLNSHAGIQGTNRPAHYHVLLDENNFSADQLQSLTNSLCYTYARCTRSVSIVPPAYYAHLAAFRARYYLEDLGDLESTSGGATTTSGESRPFHPLPVIKDNIKEVMFYC